mgnify:CR=1 FL=1
MPEVLVEQAPREGMQGLGGCRHPRDPAPAVGFLPDLARDAAAPPPRPLPVSVSQDRSVGLPRSASLTRSWVAYPCVRISHGLSLPLTRVRRDNVILLCATPASFGDPLSYGRHSQAGNSFVRISGPKTASAR